MSYYLNVLLSCCLTISLFNCLTIKHWSYYVTAYCFMSLVLLSYCLFNSLLSCLTILLSNYLSHHLTILLSHCLIFLLPSYLMVSLSRFTSFLSYYPPFLQSVYYLSINAFNLLIFLSYHLIVIIYFSTQNELNLYKKNKSHVSSLYTHILLSLFAFFFF